MWKRHPKLCDLWRWLMLWSVCINAPEIEVTWFASDDIHERSRVHKIDLEFRVPYSLWRPYCWLYGHDDDSYGCCVTCRKRLP